MISNDPKKEWLDSIASDTTREVYGQRFRVFLGYINPTLNDPKLGPEERSELERTQAKDLIETRKEQIKDPDREPEMSRLLKQFYVDLVKGKVARPQRFYKGKKPSRITKKTAFLKYKTKSAEAHLNACKQFFRYFGKAYMVEVRITEGQLKPKVTKKKYEFSTEELKKILEIAPLRDKTLILLGATAGWAAGDIVTLKRTTIEQTLNDPNQKHFWFTKRIKTNSDMYLCLSSETQEALKTYLKTLPQNETWLFPGYNNAEEGHLRSTRLDYVLKELCAKVGIVSKNPELQPLRFHGLRQYFSRKYRGRPEVREFCMGHMPKYEGAYSVGEQEIWEDFVTQDENLRIQPQATINNNIKQKIDTQDEKIRTLEDQLKQQKQYFEGLLSQAIEEGKIKVESFDRYDPRKQKKEGKQT